jgi:LysM repeat protein
MIKNSRSLRHWLLVCVCLGLMFSLASCVIPVSKAPSIEEATQQPAVPGEDIFADQPTATPLPVTGGEEPVQPAATATAVPATQAPAPDVQQPQAEIQDIEPTDGPPPATYTLQKGEFPFCIARRFDLNQSELLAINGLNLNSKPGVGTVLKLPQTGNGFVTDRALKSHPTNYTVKSGDTIYSIACQFGDVSPDMIALQNDLDSPYTLSSGQVLRIP